MDDATRSEHALAMDALIRFETLDDPADDLRQVIIDGLAAFNAQHAPPDENLRRVAVVVRDESDAIVGGAVGETHWSWLFVSHVWLRSDVRGRGDGRRLIGAVEAAAAERGCDAIYLDTYAFQAPGFYEKLGYLTVGLLDNWPWPGSRRHFLWKRVAT